MRIRLCTRLTDDDDDDDDGDDGDEGDGGVISDSHPASLQVFDRN